MEKKEKWREKLEQFKQDDRYDYLIELLLPYTAGFRAGSLDRGFLPILCEVEELLDRAREEGREEIRQLLRDKKQVQEFLKENPKFYKGKKIETAGIATLTKF